MLAIKVEGQPIVEWHTGENNPISINIIHRLLWIRADGHELSYILDQYQQASIPVCYKNRIQYWCGSIAQTIIANL